MIIRAQRRGDASSVRRVLTRAFNDDGRVADLAEALDARADRPCEPIIAEVDGDVAGLVQLSRGWIDAPARLVNVLILSPLGVLPQYQRRGIGSALSAAAVAQARALDAPAVFLEGDPAYYSRLGWRPAAAIGVTAPSVRIPEPGCQVVVLAAWHSSMVGALVYNDTFWTHDCVGLRNPE